jgi:hypothetical protein
MTALTGPFFRRGVSKFVACPSVADLKHPPRAEITAGTPLTGITAISGFQITNSPVDTPDLDSRFTSNVPGEDKAGNSALTFKDKRNTESADIRAALAKDTSLVIVYMPYGDIAGQRCESWPATSTGVNDKIDMSAAAEFEVGFATPEPPEQNAVVPAAT